MQVEPEGRDQRWVERGGHGQRVVQSTSANLRLVLQVEVDVVVGHGDEEVACWRPQRRPFMGFLIGIEGVAEELEKEGFAKESIDTYLGLFREITNDVEGVRYIKEKLSDVLEAGIAEDLETIINTVESVKTADFKMSFDPTLVRGMSYYTGPIFEISMDEFGGSVGGGGRYDEMIGKFTGNNICACGFSIGFERIVMLLLERGYEIPTKNGKKAYLIEKNMPADKLLNILKQATEERSAGTQINISIMKKNKKFQKDQLAADGYTEYVEFFNRD